MFSNLQVDLRRSESTRKTRDSENAHKLIHVILDVGFNFSGNQDVEQQRETSVSSLRRPLDETMVRVMKAIGRDAGPDALTRASS